MLRRDAGADDRELIATETHDEVFRADDVDQPLCRAPKDLIPDDVAVVVVDELEIIEVEHSDRDRPLARVPERRREALYHRQAVGEACERVAAKLGLERQLALAQLADELLALP